MKKLKLFISLLFTMFSMVVFGQAEYEKIAITANTQDNSALKVSVQSSSNEINWKYIKDFQKEKEYLSTGLIKSGVISINGDNTKYNVSAGIGIITNFDDPENPTSTIVNFPAVVAKTPSYLTTSNITYVAINSSGTVTESATPFTPEQRRTLIILGAVIHSNLTNINVVNNISAPTNASTNQLHDLMEAIGALNLSGNKFGPNNANLLMNKSAGTIFKLGSNFVNDWKNPHVLGQSALTGLTFRYRTQNGTEGSDVTSINPNVYDLNNVLTAVPSNRYSIQTITLFQSGLVRVQYGQETYGSISEAEAAISTRSYSVESNIALNGITRAYLLVKEGSTSLTNTANAKFVDAGKFGSITSGGGAITLASIIAALGYTPENDANKQNSLTTDGSGVKYPTVDAVNTKVSNIDNTSDLNKPISTATQTALNLKENTANKNIANGYAGLGSDGKLISSQLPSITITDTFVVGSQSAMLSLVAETGDVAVRTDVNKSFILQGDTPSDLADWQELLTPTSTVSSVFGRTGAVTANSGDYTADQISETASRKFQTLAQQTYNDATSSIQTQLDTKENLSNKSTSTLLGTSNTLYPTQNAVKTYVDTKVGGGVGSLEFNSTDLTVWNNGKSNIDTNTSFGDSALRSNSTGGWNTAYGQTSLFSNTTGHFNTAIGMAALSLNGSGQLNTALGYGSLNTSNTGNQNTGLGSSSLGNNASGNSNSAIGYNSLGFNITGSNNVAIGTSAGSYISPTGNNTAANQSVYLGAEIKTFANNQTNEIVIGYGAVGNGSNTVTLGNNSITKTLLNGNVGIGAPIPSVKLQIAQTASGTTNNFTQLITSSDGGKGLYQGFDITNRRFYWRKNDSNDYSFSWQKGDGTNMMTITPGGIVDITGSIKTGTVYYDGNCLTIRNSSDTANLWSINRGAGDGTENWNFYNFARNSIDFSLNASNGSLKLATLGTGLVYSNGGTLTSTNPSDSRLKDNITDLGYGLSEILKLRPVTYNWKNDNIKQGKQFGFIAQEVKEVMPELVKEFKTKDGENEVTRLGLDKEGIYAALVNAIKELKAELELLKNK